MKDKRSLAALILAAGKGKRMRSSCPKVLHRIADVPLITYVVRLALAKKCDPVVVVVDPNDNTVQSYLNTAFPKANLIFALQKEKRGTGDAVRIALDTIPKFQGNVLVLYGDVPLLNLSTLRRLEKALKKRSLAVLTANLPNPTGYGRVIRKEGSITQIVEHRDANLRQRQNHEINVGVYLGPVDLMRKATADLKRKNAQKEFYLTDCIAMASKLNGVADVRVHELDEIMGVNTQQDLTRVDAIMQQRLIKQHQRNGVRFQVSETVYLSAEVKIGKDVFIGLGVQLHGITQIKNDVCIWGPSYIKDAIVGAHTQIHHFSHIEGAKIAPHGSIGPFARLRLGTAMEKRAKVGNFVEMKKTHLGPGAKANHLAYLGDSEVGAGTNIGAGTITCNYDGGPVKHKTRIGAHAFVGSNTTLVAPIRIGNSAFVGAGSTVNQDIPSEALALGRAKQVNKEGYARRLRKRIHKS